MKTQKLKVGDLKPQKEVSLIQKLANACVTYYQAAGHNKAMMNKHKMDHFKTLCELENITIPNVDELLKIGTFNGEGAS